MLRRLHSLQPDSFAFTPANQAWAEAQITKYPKGRQASAIIPLLWRAQEQEGWLTRPALEIVADMLGIAYIWALEVASFYFMFQLQPVGYIAHIQVCGTTSCMICGAEDLVAVCQKKIAPKPYQLSEDGRFSWEEVECLGSCTNAPMAQIGKDYYEDLTAVKLGEIIDALGAGDVPTPGPQNGRFAAEPLNGLTSLKSFDSGQTKYNASVQRAMDIGDTVKRIDGTEAPLLVPWLGTMANTSKKSRKAGGSVSLGGKSNVSNKEKFGSTFNEIGSRPKSLRMARKAGADNLKMLKGVGPKLEKMLNQLGFFHFDQIAAWTEAEVAWVDKNLFGFKGRASRDNWVMHAEKFACVQKK